MRRRLRLPMNLDLVARLFQLSRRDQSSRLSASLEEVPTDLGLHLSGAGSFPDISTTPLLATRLFSVAKLESVKLCQGQPIASDREVYLFG